MRFVEGVQKVRSDLLEGRERTVPILVHQAAGVGRMRYTHRQSQGNKDRCCQNEGLIGTWRSSHFGCQGGHEYGEHPKARR